MDQQEQPAKTPAEELYAAQYDAKKAKKEIIDIASRCSSEIKGLRSTVDNLTPKAEAYDTIRQILALLPRPSQGYGEDLAWMLDKRVVELKAEQDKP